MYNYFALAAVSALAIVFLDDDPTSVSVQEWILYAVLVYAALGFFRVYLNSVSRDQ